MASAGSGEISKSFENLWTIAKSTKSKKSKSTKSKKSDLLKANLQGLIQERIFLFSKPKKLVYTYKKLLLRFWFLGIWIQNTICKLRLMIWDMLYVRFYVK